MHLSTDYLLYEGRFYYEMIIEEQVFIPNTEVHMRADTKCYNLEGFELLVSFDFLVTVFVVCKDMYAINEFEPSSAHAAAFNEKAL